MNWQEEFDNEFGEIYLPKGYRGFKDFISTEIIEKIIEDIPDDRIYKTPDEFFGKTSDLKQQLRDKWLGKEQE